MSEDNEKLLDREQVWDVLQFADSFYRGLKGMGLYTPEILHQNLLNLENIAEAPTYDKITKALSDATNNIDDLRGFCNYMEYFDSLYNKVLEYKAGMLSFDLAMVCSNASTEKDYKSKDYKDDKERINKFLFNFDYKAAFNSVVKNLLRSGVHYSWFRETTKSDGGNQKYALQTLPQMYCETTGYSNLGMLFDVNLTFLLSGTVDIDLYDPIFGKYYKELFNESSGNNYIPSNALNKRTGSWAYWVQTSPYDGAWCFTYDASSFKNVPPLANLMRNTVLDAEVQKLQYDKDFATAYGILVGEIRMKKDSKQPNDFAIDPKLLGTLLNVAQQGLKKNIKIGALPTENNKFFQYEDQNPDMYDTQNQTTSSTGVSASRIIYSTDRVSEAELIAQITADAAPLKKLYSQFAQFLTFFANRKTKKYKFTFWFDGIDYWFDKEDRRETIMDASDRGLVLNESAFAQAFGYPPHIFSRMLSEAKFGDMQDKLSQLISIHTASSTVDDKGGRPRKKRVKTSSRDYDKWKTGKRT